MYQRLQDIFSQHQNIKEAQNVAIRELVGQVSHRSKAVIVDVSVHLFDDRSF